MATLNGDENIDTQIEVRVQTLRNGQVIEKKPITSELWKPVYLITVTPGAYEPNSTTPNERQGKFQQQNKQQSIYCKHKFAGRHTRQEIMEAQTQKEQSNQPMANHRSVYQPIIDESSSIGLALVCSYDSFWELILLKFH